MKKEIRLDAIHLSEPSPQRTPVLYQAGTSPRGRQFAAQHAECVFMSGPSAKIIAPRVAAIVRWRRTPAATPPIY
jgi:alkanesulfonate monooxygenase SsuD/methylene tetrahydromethanopterin reductase-like flavin-dependent oxidoreductase (luciferase family)